MTEELEEEYSPNSWVSRKSTELITALTDKYLFGSISAASGIALIPLGISLYNKYFEVPGNAEMKIFSVGLEFSFALLNIAGILLYLEAGGRAEKIKDTLEQTNEFSPMDKPHLARTGISGPVSLIVYLSEEMKYQLDKRS
jgi:hypothetical protein